MSDFSIIFTIKGELNGEVKSISSESTPTSIDLSQLVDKSIALVAATTYILWDPTLANVPVEVTSFDLLVLLSDVDGVDIEFTSNEDDAGERQFTMRLQAGVPLILGADDAYFNAAVGSAGDAYSGTLDVIDRLRAKHNGADAGTLRMWLGKI